MQDERRKVRSSDPKTALYLYLARQAGQLGLKALAVSDEDGQLLAGTRGVTEVNLEALAALGPSLSKFSVAERARATEISVEGKSFYITSLGDQEPPQAEDVARALGRILDPPTER